MWSRYGVLQICALRFFHVGSIQFDRILIHGNAEKDAKAGRGGMRRTFPALLLKTAGALHNNTS